MPKNIYQNFRIISIIEGISYLILLFIAMPIKYFIYNPYPVKIIGMIHGLLFIAFLIALYQFKKKYSYSFLNSFKLFIYSLLPFGFIAIDKKIKNMKN